MNCQDAARFLREHDNYLILTHKRPDGDTIGCAAALAEGDDPALEGDPQPQAAGAAPVRAWRPPISC